MTDGKVPHEATAAVLRYFALARNFSRPKKEREGQSERARPLLGEVGIQRRFISLMLMATFCSVLIPHLILPLRVKYIP